MTRKARGTATLLVATAALIWPALVQAQNSPAQADAAYQEAKKLLAEGKQSEGCKKLDEANRFYPRIETMLEVAECHDKEGKIATALAEYKEVVAQARKDKRPDKEKVAKVRILALEGKAPKLSVTVTKDDIAGLDVTLDGVSIMKSDWGKPRPADPGEHVVVATAPDHKGWEGKVTLAIGDKKNVSVPALEKGKGGATPPAPAPTPTPAPAAKPADKGAAPAPAPAAAQGGATSPKPDTWERQHKAAGRVVGEISALGSLLIGSFDTGPLDGVQGVLYTYKFGGGTERIAQCDAETCTAHFKPAVGLAVGGQIFVGYAFTESFHLGIRGFGAPRIKGGWMIFGGPSASVEAVPKLWVGASFLMGAARQTASVDEVRGKVPTDFQTLNGGPEVVVPKENNVPDEAEVGSDLLFGGNIEIAYALADLPFGSLMVAAWPMFFGGSNGFAIATPLGIGLRLH